MTSLSAAAQVNLMCAIYSGAELVKAWVGEAEERAAIQLSASSANGLPTMKERHLRVNNVAEYVTEQFIKGNVPPPEFWAAASRSSALEAQSNRASRSHKHRERLMSNASPH
jgi:hypothetical protein